MSFVKVDAIKLENYYRANYPFSEILLNTYAISTIKPNFGASNRLQDTEDYARQTLSNRPGSYHYVKLTNGDEYAIPFDCDFNKLLKVIKQPTIEEHDTIITLNLKQGNYVPNYEKIELDLGKVVQIYIDEKNTLVITYDDNTTISINDLTYNLDSESAYSDLVQRWEKVLANEKKDNNKG